MADQILHQINDKLDGLADRLSCALDDMASIRGELHQHLADALVGARMIEGILRRQQLIGQVTASLGKALMAPPEGTDEGALAGMIERLEESLLEMRTG